MAIRHGISLGQIAYIGDDVNDIEVLKAVGLSAAPADGLPQVIGIVDYVCRQKGGDGAVRELAEMILLSRNESKITKPKR
jgi:YrbI family 3-deoxy-D-manno-octulosonate 8-phosphate phosphatase